MPLFTAPKRDHSTASMDSFRTAAPNTDLLNTRIAVGIHQGGLGRISQRLKMVVGTIQLLIRTPETACPMAANAAFSEGTSFAMKKFCLRVAQLEKRFTTEVAEVL